MKQLILSIAVLLSVTGIKVQGQLIRENFETHNLENVTYLPSQARFGDFIYEFRQHGALIDSSSLASYFDEDGGIFVGIQKRVTAFCIRSYSGDEFAVNSFQLSSNHPVPSPDENISVRGWRDGRAVTPQVTIAVRLFEPPGKGYDFSDYEGFGNVDEIKFTGNDLLFTLESFTYTVGEPSVVKLKEK